MAFGVDRPLWVEAVWKRSQPRPMRALPGRRFELAEGAARNLLRRSSLLAKRALCSHRIDQRCGSEQSDHPLHVIRKYMQAHLGSHLR
jgi:hypothetical protein